MTHDTLMALSDNQLRYPYGTVERKKARAALSAAISEVLAERDNTLEILKRIEPKVDALIAERDALARAGYSLTAKLCAAGVVAEKDGYELIRRESVMDLIYAWKREKEMKGTPT